MDLDMIPGGHDNSFILLRQPSIAHFRVHPSLSIKAKLGARPYENEFNLQVNEISFSYEWLCPKPRFEAEV